MIVTSEVKKIFLNTIVGYNFQVVINYSSFDESLINNLYDIALIQFHNNYIKVPDEEVILREV